MYRYALTSEDGCLTHSISTGPEDEFFRNRSKLVEIKTYMSSQRVLQDPSYIIQTFFRTSHNRCVLTHLRTDLYAPVMNITARHVAFSLATQRS